MRVQTMPTHESHRGRNGDPPMPARRAVRGDLALIDPTLDRRLAYTKRLGELAGREMFLLAWLHDLLSHNDRFERLSHVRDPASNQLSSTNEPLGPVSETRVDRLRIDGKLE